MEEDYWSWGGQHYHHRLLNDTGGDYYPYDKTPSKIDYNVLSVAAMTLALILFVELARHKLDHSVRDRTFVVAVLEGVYRELTTLGIVEFFLHLLAEYYPDYDKGKKQAFADVHFLLFYTAILNALQTVLVAVVTTRVSRTIWVQTELLEVNHYVEIREEFQRLATELKGIRRHWNDNDLEDNESSIHNSVWEDPPIQMLFHPSGGCTCSWKGLIDRFRYPRLRRKYKELLVQIRFHELRVHFLQAYELPLKLKISDYLMRAEQRVLIKLVHVSSSAWLLLTGAVILLYYSLGMVYYKLQDQELVGVALIWIFFLSMAVFVVVSWLVSHKMKSIFRTIMNDKTLWNVQNPEQQEALAQQQLNLFWFGEPKYVITAIQFMQFGYAVALSTLIIFYEEINDNKNIPMGVYFLALFFCYGVFVWVTGKSLPRYTLCTSLAQLVDHSRLNETVALFRLEEAKQKALEGDDMGQLSNDILVRGGDDDSTYGSTPDEESEELSPVSFGMLEEPSSGPLVSMMKKSSSFENMVLPASMPAQNLASEDFGIGLTEVPESEPVTHDDQTPLFPDQEQIMAERRRRIEARRARRKAKSDGVALMAQLHRDQASGMDFSERSKISSESPQPPLKAQKAVESGDLIAELVKMDTASLRATLSQADRDRVQERSEIRQGRKSRRKTNSDGVSSMTSTTKMSSAAGKILEGDRKTTHDDSAVGFRRVPQELTIVKQEPVGPQRRKRAPRLKAVSDGVAAMASMSAAVLGLEPLKLARAKDSTPSIAEEPAKPVRKGVGFVLPDDHKDEVPSNEGALQIVPSDSEHIMSDDALSTASEDGLSDVDDVPTTAHSVSTYPTMVDSIKHTPLINRMYAFLLSKKYRFITTVFGTIVAFFLVGQRVEGFIRSEEIISKDFVEISISMWLNFWLLVVWFVAGLATSLTTVYLVLTIGSTKAKKEQETLIASIFDFVLFSVCIGVLFGAEAHRCCSESDNESSHLLEDSKGALCSCPAFGTRLYGGLGTIEPYTSLVVLRVFNHWVAKQIYHTFLKQPLSLDIEQSPSSGAAPGEDEDFAHPHSIRPGTTTVIPHATDKGCGHDDHHDHHADPSIAVVEMWESVVSKHPELVAKHGVFSGEVLRAMLGVNVPDHSDSIAPTEDDVVEETAGKPSLQRNKSFSLKTSKYADLDEGAQQVILAGQLGCAVTKSQSQTDLLAAGVPENGSGQHPTSPDKQSFFFQIDSLSQPIDDGSMFHRPNARLVRSMRRCDRKYMPLLYKWTAGVDVVLTRFEIVYLDAVGVDDVAMVGVADSSKQALVATKGGKGLRLCDVAAGRTVAGRVDLSEIVRVNVERRVPKDHLSPSTDSKVMRRQGSSFGASSRKVLGRQESVGPTVEIVKSEFWKKSKTTGEDLEVPKREEEWGKYRQDSLRIETVHGHTLYLRFYSDLEELKNHPDRHQDDELFKNNAFQWAQTIARFCGPQLKQDLPHFGDNNDAELEDYIVQEFELDGKRHKRTKSSGGMFGGAKLHL